MSNKGYLLHILRRNDLRTALFLREDKTAAVLYTENHHGWVKKNIPIAEFKLEDYVYPNLAEDAEIIFMSHMETRMLFDNLSAAAPKDPDVRSGQRRLTEYIDDHIHLLNHKQEESLRITPPPVSE